MTLSDDARGWLAVLAKGEPMLAGGVAERCGQAKGAAQAFAHFARKHPDWIERRLCKVRRDPRMLYKVTSEGIAALADAEPMGQAVPASKRREREYD